MKSTITIAAIMVLIFTGCKSVDPSANVISSYYSYEIECVSKNLDASLLVKTWGSGYDIENAVLNARRKVIDDIIFKGIRKGNLNCNQNPLVSNPNIKENFKSFFDEFYSKKGKFGKYVSKPDNSWYRNLEKNKVKFNINKSYELIVTIDLLGLKEYLLQNKIIL